MLTRAVASVRTQGLGELLECLIVCDGKDVPALPSMPNVRVLVATGTAGAAGARNCGVRAARGEYLAFLDDDDEWLPGKLAAQLGALQRRPDAVAALTGVTFRRGNSESPAELADRPLTHRDLLRGRKSRWHLSTLVVRRAAAPHPMFDEAIPGSYGEDYDLLLRLSAAGPIVQVPDPLVRVQQHAGSYFAGAWPTITRSIPYLLNKHPDLAGNRRGGGRLLGRLALAEAACGRRREARRDAWRSIGRSPAQLRPYLALALSAGVLDIGQLDQLGRRVGRSV